MSNQRDLLGRHGSSEVCGSYFAGREVTRAGYTSSTRSPSKLLDSFPIFVISTYFNGVPSFKAALLLLPYHVRGIRLSKANMSDFPTLEPAFTIHVTIDPPLGVGSSSRGTPLAVVPMTGGTVKSESGFSPALDATFKGVGNDYIHNDPTGKHMRLDAHGLLEYETSVEM